MYAELHWDVESIAYIGSRSTRYANATDIDPDWTREVLIDVDMMALPGWAPPGSSATHHRQDACSS